ncbi:MAG: hypothetical protein FJ404_01880 [Verrucomicrobia bacterium]|nr:hypothetical protein [Verrucomicrobiota bacterium]
MVRNFVHASRRRSASQFLWFVGLVFAVAPLLRAQFSALPLRVFSENVQMGAEPRTTLVLGRDGMLYGATLLAGGTLKGTLFRMRTDGGDYRILHRFTSTEPDLGSSPYGRLLEAGDGHFYGTTYEGGPANRGVIYRLERGTWVFTVLHAFTGGTNDAAKPYGGLVEGSDGALYGTTFLGGASNRGSFFRIRKDGTGFAALKHFSDAPGDASQPTSTLLKGSDGRFYGTSYLGGASSIGTVFRIQEDGSGFTLLQSFTGQGGDGSYPFGGLIEGVDGLLYGTTSAGGQSQFGTLFKLGKDGSGYTLLHRFNTLEAGGHQPYGELFQARSGLLYGTTAFGGTNDQGTVFQIATNGTSYIIHRRFQGGLADGAVSYAGLAQDADGWLHGVAVTGGSVDSGLAFRMRPDGSGYSISHQFAGTEGEAASPYTALIEGRDGILYGTTFQGGHTNLGTIFRVNRDGGDYRILHSFSGPDGSQPYAGVIETRDGFLFGAAGGGGQRNAGTLFRLHKDGSGFAVLKHFEGTVQDGMIPFGRLLEADDGMIYGTTSGDVGTANYGTLFRLRPDGSAYQVLRTFSGTGGGGTQPFGGLVQGPGGWLYGTTAYRDATNNGTIFRVGKDGSGFSTLHAFGDRPEDGTFPFHGLTLASDGFLYGTTFSGGLTQHGTIFRIRPSSDNYEVLHRFRGGPVDGSLPSANAGLVEGKDGALYGVTYSGGVSNLGTVYRLAKGGGPVSILTHFTGNTRAGAQPYGGLTIARDGLIYGTTHSGAAGCGALFVLGPEATLAFSPPSNVRLLGPNGRRFSLQTSEDLSNPNGWRSLSELTIIEGVALYSDPAANGISQRFYRAVWKP